MRVVSYADEHFRTSDAVADAVLDYAMLLAHNGSSDVVRIPVVVDGLQTWARLIVGPASQITTLEVPGEEFELEDAETLRSIAERASHLERRRTVAGGPEHDEHGPEVHAAQDLEILGGQ